MGDGPLVLEDLDGTDVGAVIVMLVDLGVDVVDANRFVCSITKKKNIVSMYEVYGRGSVGELAASPQHRGLNVKGLRVIDLRFNRPDGKPWNLLRDEDQKMALDLVEAEDPDWIVGAPPCTYFSILNWNSNVPRMDPADVARKIEDGSKHLRFMCRLHDR